MLAYLAQKSSFPVLYHWPLFELLLSQIDSFWRLHSFFNNLHEPTHIIVRELKDFKKRLTSGQWHASVLDVLHSCCSAG